MITGGAFEFCMAKMATMITHKKPTPKKTRMVFHLLMGMPNPITFLENLLSLNPRRLDHQTSLIFKEHQIGRGS